MAGRSVGVLTGSVAANDPNLRNGGVSTEPSRSGKEKVVESAAGAGATGSSSKGGQVEDLMARLRLTAVESEAVVLEDEDDLDLVDPDRSFVGKVLAPNIFHIQTISSAMRPAWGNPKGLLFNPAGANLFIAEFGSKADRDRVMEGSPWKVGTHAVLMKKYDAESTEVFGVQYERLPLYCFPCGLLGHSTLTCANPEDRDENGNLPYAAKKLSVLDEVKKSGSASFAMGGGNQTYENRASSGGAPRCMEGHVVEDVVLFLSRNKKIVVVGPVVVAVLLVAESVKTQNMPVLSLEAPPETVGTLAMVPVDKGSYTVTADEDAQNSDSNKKQRMSHSGLADQAAAAAVLPPRQTQ
ncbi:hypothetical protein ACQ4PT_036096 [Festuca glaucescens]